jgi:hypothetical protein
LHDLIGKVVDKKIMEKEAVNQLVLAKLTEAIKLVNDKASMSDARAAVSATHAGVAHQMASEARQIAVEALRATKKKKPLERFLEGRKKPKEFSIFMAKGETFECPDCRKNIFDGNEYNGCICFGNDRNKKLFIKKSENGVKVKFSRGWDEDNVQMLLDVLQRKNNE